jgi:hypothetical protein
MFVDRTLPVLTALATLAACENGYSPEQSEPPTVQVAEPTPAVAGDIARRASEGEAIRARVPGEIVRRSSDGEEIGVLITDQVRVIEMQEGARCGVHDTEGALLSCEPGTFCLRSSEDAPGACMRSSPAPRVE